MQPTLKTAILRAQRLCAIQERSQYEMREKLFSWGLIKKDVETILTDLITDGFLNEVRFAKAYAGGKFRIKGWGPGLIRKGLLQHKISDPCIQLALETITKKELDEKIAYWVKKRLKLIPTGTSLGMRMQLINKFLYTKGFIVNGNTLTQVLAEHL